MQKKVKGNLELTYEYHGKLLNIKITEAPMVLTEMRTVSRQKNKPEEEVLSFEILVPGIIPAAVEIGDVKEEEDGAITIY